MKKLLLILLLPFTAFAEFKVPNTPNPVNDYANVLTRQGKESIAHNIVAFKTETGVQIGALIVPTLDGTSIEDASIAVAKNWKLGSKEKDDGVLVMLSVKEHKMRIEVGSGLEPILTDLKSRRILDGVKSYLRSGNYDDALLHIVSDVRSTIQNHVAEISTKPKKAESSDFGGFVALLFSLALAAYVIRKIYKTKKEDRERWQRLDQQSRNIRMRLNAAGGKLADKKDTKKSKIKKSVAPAKSRPKSSSTKRDSNTYVYASSNNYSSSDSSSSSSSDSGSSWSGGGGDFSGGGSSSDW